MWCYIIRRVHNYLNDINANHRGYINLCPPVDMRSIPLFQYLYFINQFMNQKISIYFLILKPHLSSIWDWIDPRVSIIRVVIQVKYFASLTRLVKTRTRFVYFDKQVKLKIVINILDLLTNWQLNSLVLIYNNFLIISM